jgi:hypothetical protein
LVALTCFGVIFCLRRRRKVKETLDEREAGPHELITTSNAHELTARDENDLAEMDEQRVVSLKEAKGQNPRAEAFELDPRSMNNGVVPHSATRDIELTRVDEHSVTPHPSNVDPGSEIKELETIEQGNVLKDKSGSTPPTSEPIYRKPVGSSGLSAVAPTSSNSNPNNELDEREEARLAILEERIERIRADKERLEQIQRLSELEEQTKSEILAARRKSTRPL